MPRSCIWLDETNYQPIGSAAQMRTVTLHQCEITVFVSKTSFRRVTSGGVAKCRLFCLASSTLWLMLLFFYFFYFQVWCLKCYRCSDAVTQCHPSGNRSTVLECTPTMNRCYMRKITEKESEDQLDVGCTNEAGCTIHHKQCASSGDCTSSCCESDLCNSGLSSKTCAISSSLLITGYFVVSLLLWVPSVHQDIFQEKNEEGKFPDKNSRQQVKVIIMNLRLSSVTRGLEGYLSRVHWGCGYC